MMSTTPRQELPACFGKDWEATSAECVGGLDPAYTHPKTGLHLREQCNFYQACGTRLQAVRNAQVIPVSNLLQQQSQAAAQQAAVAAHAPKNFGDYLRSQHAAHVEAQRQAAMVAPRPAAPIVPQQWQPQVPQQWQPQQVPQQWQPMQHAAPGYQLNYMMPGYLSTPEERQPGESMWAVLFREIFRSVFKAAGHSGAHFFDTRPMK